MGDAGSSLESSQIPQYSSQGHFSGEADYIFKPSQMTLFGSKMNFEPKINVLKYLIWKNFSFCYLRSIYV